MTQETRLQKIKEFLIELNKSNCTEIDLPYYADADQRSFDDLKDAIQDNSGFDIDIIYYSRAIEYLSNNDPSLRNSLEIAAELGYKTKDINSELLASLLASQNEHEEFNKLENEIETFFEELNEQEEAKDEEETEEEN